jgi:hypothetical protein
MTPMRAIIVGPPRLQSIRTSIAVCHSGRSDSFFGSFVKALGLSAGQDGILNRSIPYVGRKAQFAGLGSYTKDEIKLFLFAVQYRSYDYDSAIVHYPLSDDYFSAPAYHEMMTRIKSKVDFRLWREGLFS